ncbi:MAG: flagellar basal body rod protein FlgB [Rhodospirillales bacterium]|nr:flagellar basal body rod protein FlgB [Rhodospirillales bacterium]MBO6787404.1 flagellar basal body rod protein FlgB [Rhodospirillales bacterium]
MDLNKTALFGAIKGRLSWLSQRQEVLAQNIANADTPRYRASDLKPFEFKEILRQEKIQLNMNVTDASHQPGRRKRIRDFAEQTERQPFETSPTGNSVVLEEQMAKVNETHTKHKLVTQLYRKHLSMISAAVRSR